MTDMALLMPQLRALKAQVDAIIFLAEMHEAMMAPPDPNACKKCGASGDIVRETMTLANTTNYRCMSCGEEWTG